MEETIELKKYLKKLIFVIENETTFSFFNTAFIDTKRLDDILCCIQASWPENYKAFINKKGDSKIRSSLAYKKAILAIKNKFILSPSLCTVNRKIATAEIIKVLTYIDEDIKYIEKNT